MNFTFDLISDLHVESWNELNWTDQATSPYCIVAGDVASDPVRVAKALQHLGQCYAGVFYIDGNEEHRHNLHDLNASYQDLHKHINSLNNVVYMQNNLIIINGVAILSTNGWWTFDFDPNTNSNFGINGYCDYVGISRDQAMEIRNRALHDTAYLVQGVRKLQTHKDVKRIVVVTHTLPCRDFVVHDPDIVDNWRYNSMGNNYMETVLAEDSEGKIQNWAFGHYHRPVDQILNNIHYVSNPRGRGNTPWSQAVYYPKRISVEI
jgi:hypothetical protein